MPPERIELPASGLQDQRSATELWRLLCINILTRIENIILLQHAGIEIYLQLYNCKTRYEKNYNYSLSMNSLFYTFIISQNLLLLLTLFGSKIFHIGDRVYAAVLPNYIDV